MADTLDTSKLAGLAEDLSKMMTGNLMPLLSRMGPLGAAVGATKVAYDQLQPKLKEQLDTWQNLSKSGAGFSNDLIGMSVAAVNSRMNLKDFSEMISANSENLTGLGGNVTRGAEAFAKLSKDLHDSEGVESLRQLGYTNKELNDVLALQMGYVKSSMKMDDASRKESIAAASKLAEEMDTMARLTGKSREEQMENMKKAQADMQVEAKFRLIGAKDGPEAEKKARELYAQQYNEAQLRGQGQMFKEVFATGQVMSREAATQASLFGKQSKATMDMAYATMKGDAASATEAAKRGREAAYADNKNASLLQLATLGDAGGTASKGMLDMMKSTNGYYHALEAVRKEEENKKGRKLTEAEIEAEAMKRAKAAAAGLDEQGNAVGATSKALVNLKGRADDVASALASAAKKTAESSGPLYKSIDGLANKFNNLGYVLDKGVPKKTTFVEAFEPKAVQKAGEVAGTIPTDKTGAPKKTGKAGLAERESGTTGIEGAGSAAGGAIGTLANLASMTISSVTNLSIEGLKQRNKGTIEMTGKMFEDWGTGSLVALHGTEGVYRPEDIMSLVKGAQGKGVETAIKSLGGVISKDSKDTKDQKSLLQLASLGNLKDKDTENQKSLLQLAALGGSAGQVTKAMQDMITISKSQNKNNDFSKQIDSQIEAKFRIIGVHEGKAAEKSARENFAKQLSEATEKGQGQLFKEVFANAKAISKDSAMKGAMSPINDFKIGDIKLPSISKEFSLDKFTGGFKLPDIDKKLGSWGASSSLGGLKVPDIGKEFSLDKFTNGGFAGTLGKEFSSKLTSGMPKSLSKMLQETISPVKLEAGRTKVEEPSTAKSTRQLQQSSQAIKSQEAIAQQAKKVAEEKKTAEKKTADAAQAEEKRPVTGGKEATLNDVVSSINQLNNQMGRLLQQQESTGASQVRGLKQIASLGNGFFN